MAGVVVCGVVLVCVVWVVDFVCVLCFRLTYCNFGVEALANERASGQKNLGFGTRVQNRNTLT